MKINYQLIGFDKEKAERAISTYPIDALIIGDFSCLLRNLALATKDILALKKSANRKGIKLLYQLPLITKESEMQKTKGFMRRIMDLDGFITGDLGVVSILSKMIGKDKELIYTTNVLNRRFSSYLKRFKVTQIRPLMYKRVFIEEDVGLEKDVVIFGNMMLNCATFCFHSGDRIEECAVGCITPKEIIMKDEKVFLVGRSFMTDKRLDLTRRIPKIKGITSITIMDHNLSREEIETAIRKVTEKVRP